MRLCFFHFPRVGANYNAYSATLLSRSFSLTNIKSLIFTIIYFTFKLLSFQHIIIHKAYISCNNSKIQ